MSKSEFEFVQLAGCAEDWTINRAGVVKSASGKLLQKSPDGKVTVKLVNGNHRAVKVDELLQRNFVISSSEAKKVMESNKIAEIMQEDTAIAEIIPLSTLLHFTLDELEAEIKRRKLQFIDEVVEMLNKAKADYDSETVVAAVNKFMGD